MPSPRTVTLAIAFCVVSSTLMAQASWRAHLDPGRLRVATDSFSVVVRGNVVGWQRLMWAIDGAQQSSTLDLGSWPAVREPHWILSDEISMGGVHQRSDVRVTRAVAEVGLRQAGIMGTTTMRIALDRVGGEMKGTALTPTGGASPVPIVAHVDDEVIDDNALSVMLPLIRWSDGLAFTLPVLSSGKGAIDRYEVTVTGKGMTTVPAGSFETWRVALQGPRYTLTADVTTAAPYRVVRFGPKGAPMEAQLVR
jgi:hypothetical protein